MRCIVLDKKEGIVLPDRYFHRLLHAYVFFLGTCSQNLELPTRDLKLKQMSMEDSRNASRKEGRD